MGTTGVLIMKGEDFKVIVTDEASYKKGNWIIVEGIITIKRGTESIYLGYCSIHFPFDKVDSYRLHKYSEEWDGIPDLYQLDEKV